MQKSILFLLGIILLLTSSCATVPQGSVNDAMLKRETAVWQAAQDAKPEVFGSFLDPAYSGVYADGVHSRDVEIEAVHQEHLHSFALSSVVTRELNAHTQMLTYKIAVKGDFGGTDFSGDYWAMSLWRSSGGKWLVLAHTEARQPQESTNATAKEIQTEQVTGIGGVFFKVKDRKAMAAWYRENLGIQSKGGYADFNWRDKDHPEEIGHTTWAMFPTNTTYFGPSSSALMINYRVANLDRMLEQLRKHGVKIEKVEDFDYGRFAWINDPEGNRIELWEPKGK